ncbi:MAG: DUF6155 family protein [Lutibacter sp.]|nr:hypothetical protein [Lutibacter sp.]
MGFREVKIELERIDKPEIIKLISEMYKKIPSVKAYLDVFATGEIEQLVSKYKKEIERYIYPSGSNMVLRESEARKLIRTIRKMKITELNIELELHYVICCMEIIQDFGYSDDNYYIAIEKMFYSATNGIAELGIIERYEKQLDSISFKASEFGLELNY